MTTAGGRRRILAAMSGGVDSSVAAAMLVEQGHDVIGATMKTFCYDGTGDDVPAGRSCCGLEGVRDARAVADRLGIAHYVFDVEKEFRRDVMDDFVSEYARGRTPNPCVRCNSNTKFRDLFRRGRALGCDGVATGHYVRIERNREAGGARLLRAADRAKDQSYFLWGLPARLLDRLHFPLGGLTKPEVRRRARELGLVTADKPESQEICFVPTGNYRDFLARRLLPVHPALSPGAIVDVRGRIVGRHDGYAGFTVGQRRGLGGGFAEPQYVIELRPETREVVIGPREFLDAGGVVISDVNWLTDEPPGPDAALDVQIRYRSPVTPCRIREHRRGEVVLAFERAARAATPGQSAVLFEGEKVLGGGRIRAVTSAAAGLVGPGVQPEVCPGAEAPATSAAPPTRPAREPAPAARG